ncbi:MAG: copper chaperone PCu(A)C [Endozoicomonas sp. (ex Botrylloides leachii)]|nr:copper chaperone PCu(A)C [Endozoicomonas sp. (ex Botrylloides leachii)]
MRCRPIGCIGLALLVLTGGCQQSKTEGITYSDNYIRAPIANGSTSSGYITLVNETGHPIKLTGLSIASTIAEKAGLYGYVSSDGKTKMYKVASINLPIGKPVALLPGGYHIMLMGLKHPLTPATDIAVTFEFSNGEKLVVAMPVKAAQHTMEH